MTISTLSDTMAVADFIFALKFLFSNSYCWIRFWYPTEVSWQVWRQGRQRQVRRHCRRAQRKKRRRRAPSIVFPDPDRDRKPKRNPAGHLKTWEEYTACMQYGRSVWQMQRAFRQDRFFEASERRRRRRAAARAAAAAAAVTVVPANEGPPPRVWGRHHDVL
jgi:hypothetical protein